MSKEHTAAVYFLNTAAPGRIMAMSRGAPQHMTWWRRKEGRAARFVLPKTCPMSGACGGKELQRSVGNADRLVKEVLEADEFPSLFVLLVKIG